MKWLDFEIIKAIIITFDKKKQDITLFLFPEPRAKAAGTQLSLVEAEERSLTDINKMIKVSGVTRWVRAGQHTT